MVLSLTRWLQPERLPCLLCGRQTGTSSSCTSFPVRHPHVRRILEQLCLYCRDTIPWITTPMCRTCGRAEVCPDCPRRSERYYVFCRNAVRYDQRMKDLLALYKYRGSERLEPLMAAMLACALERIWTELPDDADSPLFHAITAVPLASARLEDRGFNQAERMARTLAEWYEVTYLPLLQRVRHTDKQSLKNRQSRLTDMKGNFSASSPVIPVTLPADESRPVRILLVDDVYTTGSTVNECARTLRSGLAESHGIASGRIQIFGALWARS